MQRAKIIPIISIAAFIAGGTTVKTLTANQPSVETKLPVKMHRPNGSRPLPTARSQSHWVCAFSLVNLCLGDPSVARAADSFKSVLTLKSPESLHHPCQSVSVAPICSCYNPHRQP